jgi:thioredoxin-like negative regulator of GroEL
VNSVQGLRFVTAAELEEIRRSGGSVIVAFVATWNQRCLAFAPEYQAFAARCGTLLPAVCVDVDETSALAAAFDVCSVPTILLLRAGVELHREVGLNLEAFRARLDAAGEPVA